MTRYILRRQSLPLIKIHKADREKLLSPLKILKEAGCTAAEIMEIEVQRTFPVDSKELQSWYYRSLKDLSQKHHSWEYIRYCTSQICAAYEAAKIGEEITSVTIWTEKRRRP